MKEATSISDNIAGKFLLPAIREAQEQGLRNILGGTLLTKLKGLVEDGSLDLEMNSAYKELVDEVQFYLAYQSVVELLPKVVFKIANLGVVKTSDENASQSSTEDFASIKFYYQGKADYYCVQLQKFVCANASRYPELGAQKAQDIKSNIKSAATSGLWLGGARGRRIRR